MKSYNIAALHLGPKDSWEERKVSGTSNIILMSRSRLKKKITRSGYIV